MHSINDAGVRTTPALMCAESEYIDGIDESGLECSQVSIGDECQSLGPPG